MLTSEKESNHIVIAGKELQTPLSIYGFTVVI